jgi:aspartate kinase
VSFDELLEMTATGCPKPAMRSVEFARSYRVPLHVRSAFTWEIGTWVKEEDDTMEQASVIAVTSDTSDGKITVSGLADRPGVAAALFRRLADHGVNVDMIVQNMSVDGVADISFTVPTEHFSLSLEVARNVLPVLGARDVSGDAEMAKVSIVGSGMKTDPGVAARMFETLAARGINIEMIATSPIRTSCVVRREHTEEAVNALHTAFDLGG